MKRLLPIAGIVLVVGMAGCNSAPPAPATRETKSADQIAADRSKQKEAVQATHKVAVDPARLTR